MRVFAKIIINHSEIEIIRLEHACRREQRQKHQLRSPYWWWYILKQFHPQGRNLKNPLFQERNILTFLVIIKSYNTVDKKFACTVTHYISFSLLGLLSPGEDRFEVARIFQQRLVKDPIKTFPWPLSSMGDVGGQKLTKLNKEWNQPNSKRW